MKQLINTILSMPLAKLRNFLLIKKNVEAKNLLESILYFKAVNTEISVKDVIQFDDPLAVELKRFNAEMIEKWSARENTADEKPGIKKSQSTFAEDYRLDFAVTLFQEYDREFSPNLKKL